MLLFNLLVGFKIIARKFTRYFLAENDRLEQLILFLSGCDQMACARTKEEYHLRIFRPKGLLVTFYFRNLSWISCIEFAGGFDSWGWFLKLMLGV